MAKYDPKQEGNITEQSNVNIDTAELENIMIPKLSLDTNMDKFELSETILPNPTLVFLSKPEESWYVYLVMVVSALTMLIGMTIYCKCKKKHACGHASAQINKTHGDMQVYMHVKLEMMF